MTTSLQTNKGFTLIELIVVISVIGILSTIAVISFKGISAQARDTTRRSDLKQLQAALELYHNDYGQYPIPTISTWYGYQTTGCGVAAGLTGSGGYIPNLAPAYIPILPVDPSKKFGGCSGYLYYSNGTNYKLLAHTNGPESFPSAGQVFYDPVRPTWAWMLCSDEPACSSW